MPAERISPRLACHAWVATAAVGVAAIAFLVIAPGVGDMWAALARAQAAREGVGLGYWCSWYSGAHPPGGYSVLVPWLSAFLGAHTLVALAATAVPWAVAFTVSGSRRPIVAVWVAAISAVLTLWAGRTAFLIGAVVAIIALDAAIRERRWIAAALVVLSGLASPVAVAFVLVGLGAGLLNRRMSLVPIIAGVLFLGVSAALWGSSGPEGYGWARASLSLVMLVVFFLAAPARSVKLAILIAAGSIVVFSTIPNAMGSNLARLVFAVLPVAVAATARKSNRMTALAVVPALVWSGYFTAHDLADARASASSVTTYQPLIEALKTQPHIAGSRVEVVADGTHTAAFVLARDFLLARGYETQADRSLNDGFVDREASMSADQLTSWMRATSVRYVALNRHPVKRTGSWKAVSQVPVTDMREVWSNKDWILFEVRGAQPLVDGAGTLISAQPAQMRIRMSGPGEAVVRTRWSRYLTATSPAGTDVEMSRTSDGWVRLKVPSATDVVLKSRF